MKAGRAKQPVSLGDLVKKNVDTITRIEEAAFNRRTRADIVADAIAGFCGSVAFVYVHCVIFAFWLIWNSLTLVPSRLRFDTPPFNMLTLVVSLEAIFLSTFILTSQNRQQRTADQRNHLDLQINMLAEQESSQMLTMMKQIIEHLGVAETHSKPAGLDEATDHEKLAEQIEETMSTGENDSGDSQ